MEKFAQNTKENTNNKKEYVKYIQQYSDLINSYRSKEEEIKKLRKRVGNINDEETLSSIRVIDNERHLIHLRLLEIGKKINKTERDILVDIVRKNGTLEEYGLPEFSILVHGDLIIYPDDTHDPGYFNVDTTKGIPDSPEYNELKQGNDDRKRHESKDLIKENEILLVFAIMPVKDYGDVTEYPNDFEERETRAEALSEAIHGSVFMEWDSGYHEAYAAVFGVTFAKSEFDLVVNLIRNNPTKYRLGEQFY